MSFGFSASDIIVLGQLAYRLYGSLKTDHRHEAEELEHALFGLRCALDHLGRQTKTISSRVDASDHDRNRMHEALDSMINSCASTLLDLDNIFQKHVEDSGSAKDVDQRDAASQNGALLSKKNDGLSKVRKAMRINWHKLKWTSDAQAIINIRIKLQTHIDAINMMLNLFLWSASERAEAEGNAVQKKLENMEKQASDANSALLKLIHDVHQSVMQPRKRDAEQPALVMRNLALRQVPNRSGDEAPAPLYLTSPASTGLSPRRLDAVQMVNFAEIATPECGRQHSTPQLQKVNGLRSTIGLREFKLFAKEHETCDLGGKTPITSPKECSIQWLRQEIGKIVAASHYSPYSVDMRCKSLDASITTWLQAFGNLIDFWEDLPDASKEEKRSRQLGTQALMLDLNKSIASMDTSSQRTMYEALNAAGIDRIFDKLRGTLRSVAVEKEIENFQDDLDALSD